MAIKWCKWPTYITHTLPKHQALPSLAQNQIHKPLAEVNTDVQPMCQTIFLFLFSLIIMFLVVAVIQTSWSQRQMKWCLIAAVFNVHFWCVFEVSFRLPWVISHKSWQACWQIAYNIQYALWIMRRSLHSPLRLCLSLWKTHKLLLCSVLYILFLLFVLL